MRGRGLADDAHAGAAGVHVNNNWRIRRRGRGPGVDDYGIVGEGRDRPSGRQARRRRRGGGGGEHEQREHQEERRRDGGGGCGGLVVRCHCGIGAACCNASCVPRAFYVTAGWVS